MAKPLLESLLPHLDETERDRIGCWLACPLHNRREDVIELYESLRRDFPYAPDRSEEVPLIGGGTENRLLRSYLLDRIEAYLSWEETQRERERSAVDLPLLRAYQRRGLELHLGNRIRRQTKLFERRGNYDPEELRKRYQLEEMQQELRLDRDRRLDVDFDRPDRWLLLAQIAEALRRATHSLAATPFKRHIGDVPLLKEYLAHVEALPELTNQPAISIYYHLCRSYLPDPPAGLLPFRELISLLQHHLAGFSRPEQKDLLKLLLNKAIRRLNENPSEDRLHQAFDLYRLGFERELLVDNRRVSVFTFNNFLGIAMRLGETREARLFLDRFAAFLPAARAEEITALNEARLAYASGDYDAALLHLQRADYRDFVHLMNARQLQIRIYYESGEEEALRDLIRATRALITRRRSTYHGKVYRNNLKMTQKLLNLRRDRPAAVEKLREEITTVTPLSEREWLLRQLA